MKKCSKCGIEKELTDFQTRRGQCKACITVYMKNYIQNNKEKLKEYNDEYYQENHAELLRQAELYRASHQEEIKGYQIKYREDHKEEALSYNKQYYLDHKIEIKQNNADYQARSEYKERRNENLRQKRKTNVLFKLRQDISNSVGKALKNRGSSKNGSIKKYLPYTIQDIKDHLESQFESWMTWDNQGVYKKEEWNDNDPTTWKWQLDHITPHSDFYYTSMEDQAFKDCWALSNLRPLNAKTNISDGVRRIRHNKENKE